ncbi:DUF2911 domain-containing protein [Hymenobacter chitinivorans]|uniref:DUF2911 family protein n=1 Tax=Hymenobacter chitinivorans DSM 11115 TaxID=1121954 RepID=A0A2M9AS74_9BACT|nr:DUF2911 domain-containing protein [Hymenobacter chitinivorans]PJJ48552.1 Protein of unknown function (DUF2911) [Hymenobacter chitinivorans DSM 11115]
MKNFRPLLPLTLLLVSLLSASLSWAQTTTTTPAAPAAKPAPASPAATATGKIGGANVTIKYSSPSVKGRQIYGGLVPYGQVWRAGANEATTVEFSKDVMVQGKKLPAGTYAFFVIPTEKDWTVIFNKTAKQWGAFKYDEKQDALRVTATPRKTTAPAESLAYDVTKDGIVLRWENLELPVAIK